MDTISRVKKVFTVLMAVAVMMTFTVGSCLAATSSNTSGKNPSDIKGTVICPVGVYTYFCKANKKTGTCTLKYIRKSKRSKIKSKTIFASFKRKGRTYKINKVAAGTFKGCKKLRSLRFKSKKWTKSYSFSKKAFKGLKKSQIRKIKVRVNKKMPKADYKRLKKQLKAAGIPAKNIRKNL